MLKRGLIGIILITTTKALGQGFIAEVAPLKAAHNQFQGRYESGVMDDIYYGISAVRHGSSRISDMKQLQDRTGMGAEVIGYLSSFLPGLFAAGGIRFEQERLFLKRRRDHFTDINYTADEVYDTWKDMHKYVVMTKAVGYRYFVQKLVTVSFRMEFDKDIYSSSEVADKSIKSYAFDVRPVPRKDRRQYIAFYAGLMIL